MTDERNKHNEEIGHYRRTQIIYLISIIIFFNMKIHEYQAKQLFSTYGVPVERFILCNTVNEVQAAYKELNTKKVVVKAQVLTGGRGKAGGVKLAKTEDEAIKYAGDILGMDIKGFKTEKVILSEGVNIELEYYVSFTIDRNSKSVMLMMSAEGGMDIEEVAKTMPDKIFRFIIEPHEQLADFFAREYAFSLFKDTDLVNQMTGIIKNLYKLLIEKDASLVEINPLVKTSDDKLVAIDGKMVFDDNALYRHPELHPLMELTEEEKTEAGAKEKGFSYVHMDGEIGCMVNGAGLAMATMDMIKLYGGNPANFLDIGGSSNPQKVVEAMTLLLKDPKVKVVLINIFGGITRCDDVAAGLLKAFEIIKTDIPIIVRLTGTNDSKGREMLSNTRFMVAETMGQATRMAVEASL